MNRSKLAFLYTLLFPLACSVVADTSGGPIGDAEWTKPGFNPPGGGGEPGDTGADDTGGTGSTSGSAGTTSTTGGSFVAADFGQSCGTMCDPWNPGDCPDGDKCNPVACDVGSSAPDSNICVPVMGMVPVGGPCMKLEPSDDCVEDSFCWDPKGDGAAVCAGLCQGSPAAPSCAPGFGCQIYNNGVIPVCLPDCDPTVEDCSAFADWPCAPDGDCDCGCPLGLDPDCASDECTMPDGDEPPKKPETLDELDRATPPPSLRDMCPDTEDPIELWMSNDDSNSQASPIYARQVIRDGGLVDPFRIRIHEFLNYYDLSGTLPTGSPSLAAQMRRTDDATGEFTLLVQTKAPQMKNEDRPALNIVLSVDLSGSMSGGPDQRLRETVLAIAHNLRQGDVVSMVEWNTVQAVLLDGHEVSGPDDPTLTQLVPTLLAGGGTDLDAGLTRAYQLAEAHRMENGINRVVLISDGGANVGETSSELIGDGAADNDGEGIYLVGVGVGHDGTYHDALMDDVTDAGKGAYVYIDSRDEADRQFADSARFVANMAVAARNVRTSVTLPWYFGLKAFHGEEYSEDKEEVTPQHLAPNDAMNFHQVLQACDEDLVDGNDVLKAHAEWINPFTGAEESVDTQFTLSEITNASAEQLRKADVVVWYAKSLIVIGDAVGNGDSPLALQVATDMVGWLGQQAVSTNDPEIAGMAATMSAYRDWLQS